MKAKHEESRRKVRSRTCRRHQPQAIPSPPIPPPAGEMLMLQLVRTWVLTQVVPKDEPMYSEVLGRGCRADELPLAEFAHPTVQRELQAISRERTRLGRSLLKTLSRLPSRRRRLLKLEDLPSIAESAAGEPQEASQEAPPSLGRRVLQAASRTHPHPGPGRSS